MPGLVSNIASNAASYAMNNLERRRSGKGAVRAGKGFTLFILNEDIDDIINTVKSLDNSGVLIDGVAEAVKHKIKKKERWIYWCLAKTFGCFSGTIRYYWKRSYERRKRML